mmetsp:Transcript_19642/g.36336  ORF Transcript_19642/g.36336 Transcript_19642/m.36336 type:complete len:91 (+) Transcript_19642:704-976(+)
MQLSVDRLKLTRLKSSKVRVPYRHNSYKIYVHRFRTVAFEHPQLEEELAAVSITFILNIILNTFQALSLLEIMGERAATRSRVVVKATTT